MLSVFPMVILFVEGPICNSLSFSPLLGSVSPITSDNLRATDLDTKPENLMFLISNPSNGDLALKTDLQKSITNFTQANINDGEVVFVHRGMLLNFIITVI